jgi:hypothetical protein
MPGDHRGGEAVAGRCDGATVQPRDADVHSGGAELDGWVRVEREAGAWLGTGGHRAAAENSDG